MQEITKTQALVLAFIKRHRHELGWPPTIPEIARHFGWKSPTAASQHLIALERKGYIKRSPNISRGITVL